METVFVGGIEEASTLVAITRMTLKELVTRYPVHFYELVMLARNSEHQLFGNSGEKLKEMGLLQENDTLHSSIANIVRNSVKGDELDMCIVEIK